MLSISQRPRSRFSSLLLIAIVLAITVSLIYAIGRPMGLGFAATALLGLTSLSSEETGEPEPILLGAAVIATAVMLGGMVFV